MTRTITVILCTYNRCQSLAKALDSVAQSVVPESATWEVLVVDNNSKDQTPAVVEEYRQRYAGRFRYVLESRQGKSYALNTGIREAKGNVLAFMDDDVTVEPSWLWNLTVGLFDGDWSGAGGRIFPERSFTPPGWLPTQDRYGLAPLAMFDLGPDAGDLHEAPFGTNMAFQKAVFEKYGGFRTDLGPQPGSEIRNEDTEFGRRVLEAGERLRYEPTAVVYHEVSQKRLEKRYFLVWNFDKARADIRECGVPADTKWFVAGIPLYLFRRLVVWTLRWVVTFEPAGRFSAKIKVWSLFGSIVESRRASRAAKAEKEVKTLLKPDTRSSES